MRRGSRFDADTGHRHADPVSFRREGMNRRSAAFLSAVACLALAVSTGDVAGQSATRFNPPKRYYLALGDSLAFGFQFVKFNANFPSEPASIFSTGYYGLEASIDSDYAWIVARRARCGEVSGTTESSTSAPDAAGRISTPRQ
jgi:hypothetical protein